jgi:hypothetical protein
MAPKRKRTNSSSRDDGGGGGSGGGSGATTDVKSIHASIHARMQDAKIQEIIDAAALQTAGFVKQQSNQAFLNGFALLSGALASLYPGENREMKVNDMIALIDAIVRSNGLTQIDLITSIAGNRPQIKLLCDAFCKRNSVSNAVLQPLQQPPHLQQPIQ